MTLAERKLFIAMAKAVRELVGNVFDGFVHVNAINEALRDVKAESVLDEFVDNINKDNAKRELRINGSGDPEWMEE